jgi:hypothetical protein
MRLWLAKANVIIDKRTRTLAILLVLLSTVAICVLAIWAVANGGINMCVLINLVTLFVVSYCGAARSDDELEDKYARAGLGTSAYPDYEALSKKEKMFSLAMWGGTNGEDQN